MNVRRMFKKREKAETKRASMLDTDFQALQVELYGEKALRRLKHMQSSLYMSKSRTEDRPNDEPTDGSV